LIFSALKDIEIGPYISEPIRKTADPAMLMNHEGLVRSKGLKIKVRNFFMRRL
jgi:hypothetical protein